MIDFSVIKEFELLGPDVSGLRGRHVLCFRGRYFEVKESVVEFIETLKRASSQEEAISLYSQVKGREFSEEEFERIAEKCLKPIITSASKEPKKMFLARAELFPASKIKLFSESMSFLFSKKTFITAIIMIAVLEIVFFATSTTDVATGNLDFYTILGVFILFVASSCFHELGHASACRHYGVSHGGVGVGLYLSFPVFYTDVTDTWRLKREQRLVVNTAGVYFQLLFLSPIIIIYLFTGNDILKYFIYTVNVNFLITLNPFFKFDGYWIVSDLLGVPNLRARTSEFLLYIINKIRRRPQTTEPFFLTLKKPVRYIMAVYSLSVNLFFAYIFGYVIPSFLVSYLKTLPEQIKTLAMQLAAGQTPSFALIQSIIMPTLFFGFFVYMIVRMLKPWVLKLTGSRNYGG